MAKYCNQLGDLLLGLRQLGKHLRYAISAQSNQIAGKG
jgi:hypothetical protein